MISATRFPQASRAVLQPCEKGELPMRRDSYLIVL
jgi:hypothetical protein